MNHQVAKQELTRKLAANFSRMHELLTAEQDAVSGLDRQRIERLEAEIGKVMEEIKVLLAQLRNQPSENGG